MLSCLMERQIMMKQNDRICHRVPLRSAKDLEAFSMREENHIEGTPRVIVGKQLPGGLLEVWTDELRGDVLPRLKELNSSQRAFAIARRVILACSRLASRYGFFILNQNMVFLGGRGEVSVWVNPEILENKVKIYLPTGTEGELAMIRSITCFLKLWLRFDHVYLASALSIDDFLVKFESVRARALDRPQLSFGRFAPDSRPSFNFEEENSETLKFIRSKNFPTDQAKENRLVSKAFLTTYSEKTKQKNSDSPNLFLSFPNKQKRTGKMKPTFASEDRRMKYNTSFGCHTDGLSMNDSGEHDFEHKTFNNYPSNTSTSNSVSNSVGLAPYFPNRTTSNKPKHHPIVQLINSQDSSPDQYCPNRILINAPKEEDTLRRLKESLDGIGEEVNELFLSNIESEDKEEELKGITAEFETLLN